MSMDRAFILRHLAQAEQHIAEGERHLARQRTLIDELERDGHNTHRALTFLRDLEDLQALHLAHRERVCAELEEVR